MFGAVIIIGFWLAVAIFIVYWWTSAAQNLSEIAERRGNSPKRWFWIGMLFGPLLGVLCLLALPPGDPW